MGIKLNLGAGKGWSKDGWDVVDHKLKDKNGRRVQAWNLPYENESVDVVFTSYMLEHISHFLIEKTICEVNRILIPGGALRIMIPDLRKAAIAYINNDKSVWGKLNKFSLGIGHAFVNTVVSTGSDNILLDNEGELIGGYAHVYAYDFDMMEKLLSRYGFVNIREVKKFWLNPNYNQFRSKKINQLRTLTVECKKKKHVPIDKNKMLMMVGGHDYEKNRRAVCPVLER